MNKSSIITVLGTAALGLIKSKMGSGIRIKKEIFTFYDDRYVFLLYANDRNEANKFSDALKNFIKETLEPIIKNAGCFIDDLSVTVWGGGEYRWRADLILTISKKFDHPNKYSILKEWKDGDVDDFYSYWEGENDDVRSIFLDKVMPQIVAFHPSSETGEDETFSFYTKLVDADTGEEYKPTTKTVPKLRKR